VPHSQSSLAFLTQYLGIFSCNIRTILGINVIVYIFECQASTTMADISQKNSLSVIFLDLKFAKT
jgi:hypothetical protein